MKFESLLIICISLLLQLQMGATTSIRVLKSDNREHLRRTEVMPTQIQRNSSCYICLLLFSSETISSVGAYSPENDPHRKWIWFNEQDKRGLWPSTQRPLEHWPTLAPPNLDDSELQWHPVSDPTSAEPTLDPLPTPTTMGKGYDSVIDDYLAKVDLTVADIEEEDGQLVTTIVDKQGRVLSVTFALSNDKGRELSTIKRRHTTK